MSGAPPYGEPEKNVPQNGFDRFSNWTRPEGPAKIALQAGHWKNNELPEELEKLRGSSGSQGGGKSEWEVNLAIAEELKDILEKENSKIIVEILPATVSPEYWADVFIAIHADGSLDQEKSGYKIAAPWRDYTKKANDLVSLLEKSYEKRTNLVKDPNITRNMRGYYAFAWWRYNHALHPMTTAVIVETGFLTNYEDQRLLIDKPQVAARGIAEGLQEYLKKHNLI